MKHLIERIRFYIGRIKAGRLRSMWKQTKWIYGYVRRYWVFILIYTGLGLTSVLTGFLMSLVSKDVIDIITGHKTDEVLKYFVMMVIVGVVNILLHQISGYLSAWISLRVDLELRSEIYEKIMETDWEYLSRFHSGDLLTRWNTDTGAVSGGILNFVPNLIINIFRLIGAFVMMVHYDWTFALFALVGIPFSLIASKRLLNRMKKYGGRSMTMSALLNAFNQESFVNIATIKSLDLIKTYVGKLNKLQEEYKGMRLDFRRLTAFNSILLGFVGLAVTYGAYAWGIHRVWSGVITYGTMTMFLTLSGTLSSAVDSLTSRIPSAISLTISAQRLMNIVNLPHDDHSREEEARAFLKTHEKEGFSLNVKDVSYAYRNGNRVFSSVSFEGRPGEMIGLVGPSGGGKTTMLRLLLSLIRPRKGEIEIAAASGETMKNAPYMRQFFSYVPQGNTMMSGTVRSNLLCVRKDATEEELTEALTTACARDFIERLPNGVDTGIGERGVGFSEGQAQRLAIARALLKKAPILLLDEASSALDVETERRVLKNISENRGTHLCIVTTHRPTALALCDRVYSIGRGGCTLLSKEEVEELGKGL
ncbi:MAG: ABC transporter ATP-binding protein [Lachnospiraceae bacterium]|nr:ABC transporter ATP-binding protein [Lachnospiraceae bacterium]